MRFDRFPRDGFIKRIEKKSVYGPLQTSEPGKQFSPSGFLRPTAGNDPDLPKEQAVVLCPLEELLDNSSASLVPVFCSQLNCFRSSLVKRACGKFDWEGNEPDIGTSLLAFHQFEEPKEVETPSPSRW